jgi:hypothetical protein
MKLSELKEEAADLIKRWGRNEAIAYCRGRIHGTTDVIDMFNDNGSNAILDDWEDEINESAKHWEKLIKIIKKVDKTLDDKVIKK